MKSVNRNSSEAKWPLRIVQEVILKTKIIRKSREVSPDLTISLNQVHLAAKAPGFLSVSKRNCPKALEKNVLCSLIFAHPSGKIRHRVQNFRTKFKLEAGPAWSWKIIFKIHTQQFSILNDNYHFVITDVFRSCLIEALKSVADCTAPELNF